MTGGQPVLPSLRLRHGIFSVGIAMRLATWLPRSSPTLSTAAWRSRRCTSRAVGSHRSLRRWRPYRIG
eukprot:1137835-Alexandrium_andersonii.AAC.1